ncbi:DUF1080 domain-containing protein [Fulvivirga sp. M361]|uniref:3-keto-disaccharide hydrolase n=1 Tax=Fulvivirga sp. M361 TaxID=2594266 RepID=UPI00117A0A1D|nr:DUF1080 domain-containing protein [Fulvivirga sp. M361]TRX46451.1 DUF1080 domain-containing protein [Fulvivirga sp. M361]
MKKILSLLMLMNVAVLLLSCTPEKDVAPWRTLIVGESLEGWEKKGGDATYRVEGGQVVGTTLAGTPNTFLCTKEVFSDFILEYEVKLEAPVNSGVQFRSNSVAEMQNGRVHGYQCEIDPSERDWSGGIYDEARRGWLYPIDLNPDAKGSYKHNEWNKFRVEAIGDTIKTWLNGVPMVHLVDDETQSGFIALQVHSIKEDKDANIEIRWRDVRVITENPGKYTQSTPLPVHNNFNQLTFSEEKWGWKMLWDGETTDGWKGAKIDEFPASPGPEQGWRIEDGVLTIYESGGGESKSAGDIVTTSRYSDFVLKVDFKITPGANSGIKYYVDTDLNKGEGSAIGLEYQILDDELHPDAKLGNHEGSRTLASLYDLIKSENKFPRAMGEWNHAMIVSDSLHVEHWLNGRKTLEYERKSPEYRQLVAESKYNTWDGFGELPEGQLLLQDHGNTVSFRNIKIKTN